MTVPHADREDFLRLSKRVADPGALAEAQKILFRSGAVSYCTLKLLEFSRELNDLLALVPLHDVGPIERMIESHMRPLYRLLEKVGVEDPAALALC
jgi:hypothetical protein